MSRVAISGSRCVTGKWMVWWVGDCGGRCKEIAALRDCRVGAKGN